MFGSNATRLARIDWSKYGLGELVGTAEPTPEQLKRSVIGLATGVRQLAEELANIMGNVDIPFTHRAPLISSNYLPDAPGVDPDEDELDKFFPQGGWLQGDSWYDPNEDLIHGGLAGLFRGCVVIQPAILNPNIGAGNAQNKIVLHGGQGAGIAIDNLYVTNIYDRATGSAWSAFPAGSVILWAGAIGSIPSGWALMDGTANSVGNGGSGIDMSGRFPLQYISGDPTYGTIGATVTQALIFDITGGTTVSLTINNESSHTHTVSTTEFNSKISAHAGSGTDATSAGESASLTPAPSSGDFDGGTAITMYYWTVAGGTPQAAEHQHVVDADDIATALASHTISSALSTSAGSSHNHTGTVSVNSIGDALVDSAPSTLRPPGTVLAYIEKLSA